MLGNSYIPVGEVITDASQELRDTGFTHGIGMPFYLGAAQRGITEMNTMTNFHKKVFQAEIPESLVLDLPDDLTDMDQAYVFRGDRCTANTSAILFIKPNLHIIGRGGDYISQNKGRNRDAMQFSIKWNEAPPTCLYYAGLFNGKLSFSPSCLSAFGRVFIPYSGIGVDCFGEEFKVPMWLREALKDYVVHKVALALEREDIQFYRGVIQRKEAELKLPNGSWARAQGVYKRMDKKTRYDTAAYTFDFGHYI